MLDTSDEREQGSPCCAGYCNSCRACRVATRCGRPRRLIAGTPKCSMGVEIAATFPCRNLDAEIKVGSRLEARC